eukprot:6376935-Pyramimonas_sp.AAC.1
MLGAAVLALGAASAFNALPRQAVLDAVGRLAPSLFPVASAWLTRPTTHFLWNNRGAPVPASAQTAIRAVRSAPPSESPTPWPALATACNS